jgi:teichuronic acid biosynthesis glycosyltransferase TuaG
MNESPKISVIMPAYNAVKTIEESIRSVLAQTYKNYELLIIDDCSTDSTSDIVSSLIEQEPQAKLYRLEVNSGTAHARNYGVSVANGEWIAFLDSDDLWKKDKLLKHIDFIQKTNAAISYTATSFITFDGKPYKYVMRAKHRFTYRNLLRRNLMSCSSVIVRKDMISHIKMGGGMMHEDYATWLQILRETKYAYGLDEPLLIYRLSKSSKSAGRLKSALMVFNCYLYVGYGRISAFCMTLRYSLHSNLKRLRIYARL